MRPDVRRGLTVHLVGVVVFIIMAAAHLEGCDRADSLGAALFLAIVADLLLVAAVTVLLVPQANRHRLKDFLQGWVIGCIPAAILAGAVLFYINSVGSGCP